MLDALEGRVLFATLVAGQTVTTAVRAAGQSKNWEVTLKAGQFIAIAAGDNGTSSFAPTLRLIGPNHRTVRTAGSDTGAFLGATVPTTGTYVIRLNDLAATNTGSATVTAFYTGSAPVTDSDDASTAQSGRRFAATLSPGDLDVWRVDATTGQFLSVVAAEGKVNSALDIGVALVKPDGTGYQAVEDAKSVKIDVPSATAGTYYAVAYVPKQNATGRYGISFAQTPGTQYSGDPDTTDPLVSGQTRNGDLPSGDIDVYQASLNKGHSVTVAVTRGSTGTIAPEILLVDPNAKIVKSASGTSTATLTFTLLTSGTYSIVLRNVSGDAGGAYTFKYTLR